MITGTMASGDWHVMEYEHWASHELALRIRVGSELFFHRYVQITVPDGDVAIALIRQAAGEMRGGSNGGFTGRLREWMDKDAPQAITKLSLEAERDPIPLSPLMTFLGDYYLEAADTSSNPFLASVDLLMCSLAKSTLASSSTSDALDEIRRLSTMSASHLALVVDCVRSALLRDGGDDDETDWAEQSTDLLVDSVASHFGIEVGAANRHPEHRGLRLGSSPLRWGY